MNVDAKMRIFHAQSLPPVIPPFLAYRDFSVCVPDPVIVYDCPCQSVVPLMQSARVSSPHDCRALSSIDNYSAR